MRPINGVIQSDGSVLCENGLIVTDGIPKGVKRHDCVIVMYDYTMGCVVGVEPDVPSEEMADLDCYTEAPCEQQVDGEIDDAVETDGLGLS